LSASKWLEGHKNSSKKPQSPHHWLEHFHWQQTAPALQKIRKKRTTRNQFHHCKQYASYSKIKLDPGGSSDADSDNINDGPWDEIN